MPINTIDSNTKLIDIEKYFKVSAGPGAGKTYWLVNHIKNILHNTNRLSATKKIACITYTNIAVETILNRLGTSSTQVEVSTIHSFLYKHIVKPYVLFIAKDYDLAIDKIDGHDDVAHSLAKINKWIENHPNSNQLKHPYSIKQLTKLENNQIALKNWLSSTTYKFNSKESIINIETDNSKAFYLDDKNQRKYLNKQCLNILKSDIINYKKSYWEEGKISHDDVLFFSHQIIEKFSFIIKVLSSKFPYLVIDEFQDSNPIQVELFKRLGLTDTVIGIIGDSSQSIYEFQGADYKQFNSFSLPNIQKYILEENRRSSNEIVDLLNKVRNDITQTKYRDISRKKPIIFIGDIVLGLEKARTECDKIHTLSRDNITSNALKVKMNGINLNGKLLEELKKQDSNRERRNLVYACIKSISYAKEKKFKDSIKELEKIFRNKKDEIESKRKALEYIGILLTKYNEFNDSSLLEFSNFIRENIDSKISKVSRGKIKDFYENNTFQQLSLCVSIPEDMSFHKTIHKAKGDEFDNVLLVLKKEEDLSFLTNSKLNENEEHRIYYVAISRAKNRLFISVPTLNQKNQNILAPYFDFIYV